MATHDALHDAKTAAHASVQRTSPLTVGLLVAGMLVGGLTGVMVVKSIVRPVDKLVAATRFLAAGDLTQRVDVKSADELFSSVSLQPITLAVSGKYRLMIPVTDVVPRVQS